MALVREMEFALVAWRSAQALIVWWYVVCLYGSMRFDDQLHIVSSSLRMRAGGLEAVAWQTKCERKRRGTRFIIADVGVHGLPKATNSSTSWRLRRLSRVIFLVRVRWKECAME